MIIRLKYAIEFVLSILVRIFHLIPLQKSQVFLSAFSGRQYSDSPRRISEYLQENHPDIRLVWAFIEPEKYTFLQEKGIKIVKYKSIAHLYYALTSKVYVDNVEYWSLLRFRKKQLVIQTWHGGGAYKRIGADRLDIGQAERRHTLDKMNRTKVFVSSGRAFTEKVIRGSYRYDGEVLEVGLPRNDELLRPDLVFRNTVREKLEIPADAKIVLYAPTFRNSHNTDLYDVDYTRLRKALSERFGGNWIVLLRMHYYMTAQRQVSGADAAIIDVSEYPDMQDLLRLADVLVTDYSSTLWDFSLMERPCFVYATDIKAYRGERDFYTPITEWPFPLAQNNDELEKEILSFNEDRYVAEVKRHHAELGNSETGTATAQVCTKIAEYIGGEK